MKKYRIKEITSSHTGKRIFIPEVKVLGIFWRGFERTEFSDFYFDTLEEAREWLRDQVTSKKEEGIVIHEA